MSRYDYPRQEKQPGEDEVFNVYFPTLAPGENITSVVSFTFTPSTSPDLTLGTPTFSGKYAQVRIADGLSGTTYRGTVRVTTSLGNTVEADVKLVVKEL